METKKKKNNYIDNKKFLVEISKYVELYHLREANGEELPRLNDYLGKCFMDIATNLSNKYNFSSYKFKEDMISDSIFDCVRYAHKFNPQKTNNPFAYFTTICVYAFIRKIQKEKKILYTKYKAINNSEIFGLLHTISEEGDKNIIDDIGYSESARENMMNFVKEYEAKNNIK